MKRFVFAGLFIALGIIILGVATSSLMSGPDKPHARAAGPAASATPKAGGHGAGPETNNAQPPPQPAKPVQPTAAPPTLPGMPAPLSTMVQPPGVRPPPEQAQPPHVPGVNVDPESQTRRK